MFFKLPNCKILEKMRAGEAISNYNGRPINPDDGNESVRVHCGRCSRCPRVRSTRTES